MKEQSLLATSVPAGQTLVKDPYFLAWASEAEPKTGLKGEYHLVIYSDGESDSLPRSLR